ncbi:MAG TPA: DUF2568 domain-containing protein [Candidatus Limnocylindria bacterium]
MSQNLIVLGLHFLLELAALASLAYWGWTTQSGIWRIAWSAGLVVVAAGAWAVFRAAGDGPDPVVAIPGALRLVLELAILGGAAAALAAANRPTLALIFAALIVVDYVASYDRVVRLLTGA